MGWPLYFEIKESGVGKCPDVFTVCVYIERVKSSCHFHPALQVAGNPRIHTHIMRHSADTSTYMTWLYSAIQDVFNGSTGVLRGTGLPTSHSDLILLPHTAE